MKSNIPLYLQKEEHLFEWLKKEYIPDLKQAEGKHSKYDCFSDKYSFDIEIKCRQAHYDDLIIEKKKYDFLIKRSSEYNTIPLYINSTPKGVWVFYIKDLSIIWTSKMLPKKTYWDDGTFINKEIGYLNILNGLKIDKL